LIATLALLLVSSLAAQNQDVIFRALQDELSRNSEQLVMEDLEQPYYIAYTVDDYQLLEVKGSLGTLTNSRLDRGRYLTVDLRVGDYELDNTNFHSGWASVTPLFESIPVDNDYDALRNKIYLTTDQAYKDVLKNFSRKKAYLQSRVAKSRPADFVKMTAERLLDKPEQFDADRQAAEKLVTEATELLREYPLIVESELAVEAGIINQYFINTHGAQVLRGDRVYTIEMNLTGQDAAGETVHLSDRLIVQSSDELPDAKSLSAWARKLADRLNSFVAADTVEEYIGPVIIEGDAAGEFFRQLFVKNISNLPAPTYEDERFGSMFPEPAFGNKINRRVLPDFFNVYCDPTLKEYQGLQLLGHYEIDDAGIKSQRLQLVEKGKLRAVPLGTAPTKKIPMPNGHARGAVSKPVTGKASNLIFESSDQVSNEKLRQSLIELCQDVDMEYGLIIRKIRDLNAPDPDGGMRFFGMPQQDDAGLSLPLEVYKLYPDGREVPVRGLEFANVTVRTLRDILQTDDQQHLYNYLIADDYEMPASLVCPAILIEEMELGHREGKSQKPPVLQSPLAEM
jgi:hypothetical protein